MAEPVEVAIESALLTKAQAFAAAQSPAIAISLPNVAFTPPAQTATAKWLRATFMPAPTSTLPVGSGSDQYYGMLQIDVFYGTGSQGTGEYAPGRIASAVIDYFKRGTPLSKDGFTVRIHKRPYRGPMIIDGSGWVQIPVTIPFECFATA
jgi:hypothetical protein